MQLRFRITIWYVPVANRGFDGQVTNLEAKLNESSGTLVGSGVHCWLDPHPRVTTVAKRPQPSRRLPSPATERARDLRKKAVALSCKQRARNPWKEAVALSRNPRARHLTEGAQAQTRNSILASRLAKLASRISKTGGSDDFRTFRQGGVSDRRRVRDRPGDGFSPASDGSYRGGARPR